MARNLNVPGFFAFRIRPVELAIAGGATLATATLLSSFGRFWWFFDLFTHFRVQLFLGLLGIALVLLLARRIAPAFAFALIALVNLWVIVPCYLGKEMMVQSNSHLYRGLLVNVNRGTGDPQKVARLIESTAPDIVALEEVDELWLAAISRSVAGYKYNRTVPRTDSFGIALYSKYPFAKCETQEIGEAGIPSVIAELTLPDVTLTVIATHPVPPAGAENSHLRDDQLSEIAALARRAESPVLLLGDLNATPWCYTFSQLLKDSGLKDASQGRGVLATWPTFLPLALIPIDHCLHSPRIHVARAARGPKVGSDHYPLIVEFTVDSANRKVSSAKPAGQ